MSAANISKNAMVTCSVVAMLAVGAAALFGQPGGLDPDAAKGVRIALLFLASISLTAMGVSTAVFGVTWWLRQDEVIKEAHQSAWLWGGLAGFAAWAVTLFTPLSDGVGDFLGVDAVKVVLGNADYLAGGLVLIVAMLLGYLAWLAAWWVRKR